MEGSSTRLGRSVSSSGNPIVKLNVGGVRYLTTEQTLTQNENFFSALLGGKIPSHKDEEGYYFIDRDGDIFKHLLNFLRSGRFVLPEPLDESLLDAILEEASFYSIDLHSFAPLSDAALSNWLEQRKSLQSLQNWSKFPELEQLKEAVLNAFRHEISEGEGRFEFVFYPEVEGGSISRFISLIGEDDVSPDHRKVIHSCKTKLEKIDFAGHPYYPLSLSMWNVLQLPQCQNLIVERLQRSLSLSIEFRLSRIGVARVEKKSLVEGGASVYRVHDFYALTGFETESALRTSANDMASRTLRQQFDRCVSAILVVWKVPASGVRSPKLARRTHADEMFLSTSPPDTLRYTNL